MRRHARVRDDAVQVGLVLVQRDALVVGVLRQGGVVGAEEDELLCRASSAGERVRWLCGG